MSRGTSRLTVLRGVSPAEALRMVFRKLIYRRTVMGRYETTAGASRAPRRELELRLELLGPERFDTVLGTNPHLDADDLEHFRRQRSTCIVALDGERIVASSWMTSGLVYVDELQRTVEVPEGEHFSTRSFVDPAYRGLSLLSHLIHGFSAQQPDTDTVWGLVYDWNVASVRSLERLGWRMTGRYSTTVILGRRFSGQRRSAPRPPTTIDAPS
jgi:hypothetical protein